MATRIKKAKLLMLMGDAVREQQRRSYWEFVNNCMAGRRTQAQVSVSSPALEPGTLLKATDREYVVQRNGSWRCIARASEPSKKATRSARPKAERLTASQSMIRLLPEKPDLIEEAMSKPRDPGAPPPV